jgi:tRNA uridine 5-carboxymethylaminomethyl modification enzyme
VLTNGTFLNGKIHIGEKQFGGGRAGESAAYGITEDLINAGFESGRMKQGLKSGWTFFGFSERRKGDARPDKFSYSDLTTPLVHQRSCHMTYTSLDVHDILRGGFDRSPMFNGSKVWGQGIAHLLKIK